MSRFNVMPRATLLGFPIKTSRWRIALLRLVYPRRAFVQIRKTVYMLRLPSER